MTAHDAHSSLLRCLEAATRGANVLLKAHKGGHRVTIKDQPIDLVTEFDKRSEAAIVEYVHTVEPDAFIVAEEGGPQGHKEASRVWWIDPLDGTTNFAHGLPLFSVSVAVYENGNPLAAVVVAPALGWQFAAARGCGATMNGQPIRVSTTSKLCESLLVTGFPYDRRTSADNNFARFEFLAKKTHGVRRLGSAALDLCLVARGWLDGYWEKKLKPWDIAAGVLIAAEAGARITSFDGGPMDLLHGEVLATNGLIHNELLEALACLP